MRGLASWPCRSLRSLMCAMVHSRGQHCVSHTSARVAAPISEDWGLNGVWDTKQRKLQSWVWCQGSGFCQTCCSNDPLLLRDAGEDTGESIKRRAHPGKSAEMRVYVLQVKLQVLSNLYHPQVIWLGVWKLIGLDAVDQTANIKFLFGCCMILK